MAESTFEQQMQHLFREYNKKYTEDEILNLLDEARAGSEEAKKDIICYISKSIFNAANSLMINRNVSAIDIWDLYQTGIVAVVKTAIPSFQSGEAKFITYAINCAKFKMRDEITKQLDAGIVGRKIKTNNNAENKVEKGIIIQSVDKMMEDAGDQTQREISDAYAECEELKNPEAIVMAEIESEKLKELISQLTPQERKVVNMHIYQGDKTFEQIADELDLLDFEVKEIYTDAVNKLTELIR